MTEKQKGCISFLEALASDAPTPGGGSAAALTGALGSSLLLMVCRINAKKKSDIWSKKRIKRLCVYQKNFLALQTLDEKAYQKISSFNKALRATTAYQRALKKGAEVPLKMGGLCVRVLDEALAEKPRTSSWLMSDLSEAVILLEAAYESARLNVEINLRTLKDRSFCRNVQNQLNRMRARIKTTKKKVFKA